MPESACFESYPKYICYLQQTTTVGVKRYELASGGAPGARSLTVSEIANRLFLIVGLCYNRSWTSTGCLMLVSDSNNEALAKRWSGKRSTNRDRSSVKDLTKCSNDDITMFGGTKTIFYASSSKYVSESQSFGLSIELHASASTGDLNDPAHL